MVFFTGKYDELFNFALSKNNESFKKYNQKKNSYIELYIPIKFEEFFQESYYFARHEFLNNYPELCKNLENLEIIIGNRILGMFKLFSKNYLSYCKDLPIFTLGKNIILHNQNHGINLIGYFYIRNQKKIFKVSYLRKIHDELHTKKKSILFKVKISNKRSEVYINLYKIKHKTN